MGDATPHVLAHEVGLTPPCQRKVYERLAKFEEKGVRVQLYRGDTKDVLPRLWTSLPAMDFVFIDGGHSLETVASDWFWTPKLLHSASVVVFDDYVNPEALAFDGYGTNSVIDGIDRRFYDVQVLEPPDMWPRPYGLLVTRLVRVVPRGPEQTSQGYASYGSSAGSPHL